MASRTIDGGSVSRADGAPSAEGHSRDGRKNEHALWARGIGVVFSGKRILKGIDVMASSGQVVGVLGPSGCGKSTLLHALSAFRPPSEGSVRFDGVDLVENFADLREQIGFVPQDDVLPMELRVGRVLEYAALLRLPDLDEETRASRIAAVLRILGLTERRGLRVDKLSGGQRKRVSVAVELLARPSLLFADEPTSGLDPALEAELMAVFRRMANDGGIVVLTTHIMSSLETVDRVIVLHEGRLVYSGAPRGMKGWFGVDDYTEVYRRLSERSASEWARRFSESG